MNPNQKESAVMEFYTTHPGIDTHQLKPGVTLDHIAKTLSQNYDVTQITKKEYPDLCLGLFEEDTEGNTTSLVLNKDGEVRGVVRYRTFSSGNNIKTESSDPGITGLLGEYFVQLS